VVQGGLAALGQEGHVDERSGRRRKRGRVVDRAGARQQEDLAAAAVAEQVAAVELRRPDPVGDERAGGDERAADRVVVDGQRVGEAGRVGGQFVDEPVLQKPSRVFQP
jgi:hypothetical protein